ncbi:MAG TPA: isoprenylcysteine carboxylmethyltransferase family protein [Rhodocyclaceae bacterium]|nr:isoprenylcysteine carboxylmethyltransferase family protein [Rhodocyclaceae bacterium]
MATPGVRHPLLVARTHNMQNLETKIPAPVVAIVVGSFMKLYAWMAQISIDNSSTLAEVGIRLSQLSAVIAILAFASFGVARTTINPLDPSRASTLVTGGVFRITRNPMYLSLLLLLVAYAVRLGSLVEWLGPALFVSYVTRFQIIPEERILAMKFGSAFLDYKDRTRRLI